ncbi:putative clathrin assembly protein At4g40080 [Vigna unguiculata]|nr:putative clathrin assembly protein At4g40080 [Vigna unguiculata]
MTKLKELIGRLKDKASQGKAAILSKRATLSLLRATSHDPFTPPTSNHISALLIAGDGSRATASAVMELLMDRLQSTQSSAVALKCLIAVHYVLKRGSFIMRDQLPYRCGGSGGRNYLNLSKFRDRSSPVSWELSSWVRWYAKHVEQLLWASRIVGFFLGVEAQEDSSQGMKAGEERASGLSNGEVLTETEALLAVIEGIGGIPDAASMEGNKVVGEISSMVEEDVIVALSEVLVRVNELRERFGCLSFGEVVELVYVMNRLEKCKEVVEEVVVVAEKQRLLWDAVREVKEKVEKKVFREEEKTMRTQRHRATKSDRFQFPTFFIDSVDLVRFPSARLLL